MIQTMNSEFMMYSCIWIGSLIYATVELFKTGFKLHEDPSPLDHVTGGWYRDTTDLEWKSWKYFTRQTMFFLPIYLLLSRVGQKILHPKLSSVLKITFSLGIVSNILGTHATAWISVDILIMWISFRAQKSWFVWLVYTSLNLCSVFIFDLIQFSGVIHMLLFYVILAWNRARCLSFALDRIWGYVTDQQENSLLELFSFCFYLPLIFSGPLITSQNYKIHMENRKPIPWSYVLKQSLKLSAWIVIAEFSTFVLYQEYMTKNISIIEILDFLPLCGAAYYVATFFFLKYYIFYGVSNLLLTIDGVEAPSNPKCTSIVYLYSDMWRSFDVGLYQYCTRYVYFPIKEMRNTESQKFLAGVATFAFVALFHGITQTNVLVWVFLNWFGILIETFALQIYRKRLSSISEIIGFEWRRRFAAFLSTFLLMMSCFSCFYFLRGMQPALAMTKRLLLESTLKEFLLLFLCMYSGVQVAIDLNPVKIIKQHKP